MTKLILSQKLTNILKCMGDNNLAKKLLSIQNKDIKSVYNYIDISDNDDLVTFIPTSKLEKLLDGKPDESEVVDNGRYLKPYSNANRKIFATLGYDPGTKPRNWDEDEDGYGVNYIPDVGTIGIVVAEATGEVSGNTYCLFRHSDGKEIVFNKESLKISDNSAIVWKTNRNAIKIGRFIRSIFDGVLETNSKDIEEFVNKYKAAYAMEKDELKKFDIVSGSDIRRFYNKGNYLSGGGPLNNSCMASVDSDFFDIYVDNARMVVLYTNGGHIKDDKYVSDKIRGRAILWNDVTMDGEPITFMDRVYTTLDSDVELFKAFAKENGWWYKKNQSMEPFDNLTNGDRDICDAELVKKMICVDYENYPFLDTLCHINMDTKIASNVRDDYHRRLRSTGGGYEHSDDYDED